MRRLGMLVGLTVLGLFFCTSPAQAATITYTVSIDSVNGSTASLPDDFTLTIDVTPQDLVSVGGGAWQQVGSAAFSEILLGGFSTGTSLSGPIGVSTESGTSTALMDGGLNITSASGEQYMLVAIMSTPWTGTTVSTDSVMSALSSGTFRYFIMESSPDGTPVAETDYLGTFTTGGATTTVPEPASLALLGCGLIGTVGRLRKRT